ncbi:MAG: TetR/AcrR family transcriptional regulator, partial [Gammaproteobacteria bacterium]|nr:TetR/AcrR family transcriptional regulator [Gammaproteobacteria bacterium]
TAHLTLETVAHSAGISKGGLLYHFPSKEALLTALIRRYCDSIQGCIESARNGISADPTRELQALVAGILGNDEHCRALGAVLLAIAATDTDLLETIRERIADHTRGLAASGGNFARAAAVALAIDGMKMRESLRISTFTPEQRTAIVNELLQLAAEAYR